MLTSLHPLRVFQAHKTTVERAITVISLFALIVLQVLNIFCICSMEKKVSAAFGRNPGLKILIARANHPASHGNLGWVAEWFKAPVLKTGEGSRPP